MTRSYGKAPSPAAALLQLARLKAGLSQRELAERASVPTTMISAYERDKRQPSLATLLKLLQAAGFELTMKLEPRELHDEVLATLEHGRSVSERRRRDREIEAWRQARPAATAT
jgi:transcriptional regulator with XRE-family HTH domain